MAKKSQPGSATSQRHRRAPEPPVFQRPGAGETSAVLPCPKLMVYGPCGGVRSDGSCEVDGTQRCPFVGEPLRTWDRPSPPPGRPVPLFSSPLVVTDLHVAPRDVAALLRVADLLKDTCEWVLVGDHGGARNDFAPSFVAQILVERGLRPWITLSCRDRNRVALGSELAALAEIGVAGVHCVTGDWQGLAGSAGESKVFDLDSLRLVELARTYGLTVSVAASPAVAPLEVRPARLAAKVAAGAQLCFVNHSGGPLVVGAFLEAARHVGVDIPIVACVAVTADQAALSALEALPGTRLDDAAVREAAGLRPTDAVDIAVDAARRMLAVPGVSGVNLSGAASSGSDQESARIMAAIGSQLRQPLVPGDPDE